MLDAQIGRLDHTYLTAWVERLGLVGLGATGSQSRVEGGPRACAAQNPFTVRQRWAEVRPLRPIGYGCLMTAASSAVYHASTDCRAPPQPAAASLAKTGCTNEPTLISIALPLITLRS
jgi:hypothetical protein